MRFYERLEIEKEYQKKLLHKYLTDHLSSGATIEHDETKVNITRDERQNSSVVCAICYWLKEQTEIEFDIDNLRFFLNGDTYDEIQIFGFCNMVDNIFGEMWYETLFRPYD